MLVDLHVHECTFSKDSKNSLEEIVESAKRKGLDGVCITDHDSMGLKETAEKYSKEVNFPIFVGVEVLTNQGDILAFGIDRIPDKKLDAQQFIDYVKELNGVCFSAHPFRNNNRGLEENLLSVNGLDGIEVLNGNTDLQANKKALEYCKILGLQAIGASDSHSEKTLGKYATKLPKWANNLGEFIDVLKLGQCKPAVLEHSGYRILEQF
ncbi:MULTISPECIES: PHP domain-containing protein [unclassified Sedimentibacter]|uniref:PHP domain-containing protein n=1 Tax=unclassified Sedimentibacter TaxID=2649220 RepID=UPI0027E1A8A8|nr:PHP domain-containing protein [Sedimentibacter sp. MB35-C1]WMJ76024.1 PHP domain-containing protein [Sedimentibacter sp. MB35-C1]